MPVLIFPEGTRSPMGGLGSFKRGAFEIACRARVPVLPVLIRCEPSALSKGRPWYDIPPTMAYLTLTPLPLVRPEEFGNDATAMARAFEAMYRYRLNLPTDNTDPQADQPSEQGDDGNRSRAQASHR
jgi:1-acyl-sn-glycerol-3-phosphate acyltransferase